MATTNSIIRLVLYLAIGYSLLVMLVFLMQRRMIYAPESHRPAENTVQAMGLRFWPEANENFRGFVSTAPSDRRLGTVIAFHGNAGSAWQKKINGCTMILEASFT